MSISASLPVRLSRTSAFWYTGGRAPTTTTYRFSGLDAANAVLGGMTCSPFVRARSGNRPEGLPGRWDDPLLELLPLALLADLTLASTCRNPRDDRRVLTPTSPGGEK